MSRSHCLPVLPAPLAWVLSLLLLSGCGEAPTGPAAAGELRLVRLVEYPLGGHAVRQQGDYTYEDGRLVRFDFGGYRPGPDGAARFVRTYFSTHEWLGDRRHMGEVWIVRGDEFVQSKELSYDYDEDGRLGSVAVTHFLDLVFDPIREVGTQRFTYDAAGRLIDIRWDGDSAHVQITYDEDGEVATETLTTEDGSLLEATHTYGESLNPFHGLHGHGLLRVYSNWAELLSRRQVIRTENRVNGGPVVSWREVYVLEEHESGYPAKSVQYLRNASAPDDPSVFVAEYEYGVR